MRALTGAFAPRRLPLMRAAEQERASQGSSRQRVGERARASVGAVLRWLRRRRRLDVRSLGPEPTARVCEVAPIEAERRWRWIVVHRFRCARAEGFYISRR